MSGEVVINCDTQQYSAKRTVGLTFLLLYWDLEQLI